MDRYVRIDNLFKDAKEVKRCLIEDMDRLDSGREMNLQTKEYEAAIREFSEKGFKCDIDKTGTDYKNMSLERRLKRYEECLNQILYHIILERRYYCHIGRSDMIAGLASHALTNLGNIAMALYDGYIPVVDTVEFENIFQGISKIIGQNAWEFFFRQPFGKKLDEIPKDSREIYAEGIPQLLATDNTVTNSIAMNFWKRMLRTFMPVSENILACADAAAEQLGMRGKRVTGVLCRGTDYMALRPYQHPVQPRAEEVIRKTKETMEQYHCDLCYLATEDENVWQAFKKELGDKLICSQTMYYEKTEDKMLYEVNAQWKVDVLEKNREYLTALVLLSRCCCFLSGKTSGMILTQLLAEKLEYFYAWDYGTYGVSDPQLLQLYML